MYNMRLNDKIHHILRILLMYSFLVLYVLIICLLCYWRRPVNHHCWNLINNMKMRIFCPKLCHRDKVNSRLRNNMKRMLCKKSFLVIMHYIRVWIDQSDGIWKSLRISQMLISLSEKNGTSLMIFIWIVTFHIFHIIFCIISHSKNLETLYGKMDS